MSDARFPKPARHAKKSRKPIPRRGRKRMPEALARHRALEKQADRLWSLIVRLTQPHCQRCRMKPTSDADHLISRRYRATRWDLRVGAGLCKGCHMDVTSDALNHVALAEQMLGPETWRHLNIIKTFGRVDPALAVVALQQEIRERGLEAQARERGLIE